MRALHATLIAEKNKLAATSAWLPLIEVEVSDTTTIRVVPNPVAIVWDGNTFTPFPFRIEEAKQDTAGGLNEVRVSISNVTREMSAFVEANDMRGRRVKILYVNTAKLDDPVAFALEEVYEIVAIVVNQNVAVFTLGHERILSSRVPAGRYQRDNCRWIYKSAECGYTGTLPNCDKILNGPNGCRAHGNVPRFGGFPLLPNVPGRLT